MSVTVPSPAPARPARAQAWPVRRSAGVALVAAAVGVLLAATAHAIGPRSLVLLPAAGVLLAAVARHRWAAPLLPLAVVPVGFAYVGPLQLVELATLAAVCIVVGGRALSGAPPVPREPVLGWAAALVALALLSLTTSVDPARSARAVALLLGGVLLAVAVVGAAERPLHVRRLATGLVAATAVVAAMALLGAGPPRAAYGGAVVTGRAVGPFAQPNELALVCAVVTTVAVGLAIGARTVLGRLLATGAALLIAAALVASLSRGGWLGGGAALIGLAVLLPRARRTVAAMVVAAVLGALAVAALAPTALPGAVVAERLTSIAQPSGNPYDERPAIYREALRQVQDAPLLGQGPGTFPVVAGPAHAGGGLLPAEHAHDALLTVAAEVGLPAAAVLVILTAAVGVAGHRAVRRAAAARPGTGDDAVAAGLAAGLLAVVVHGLVDYPLRNAVGFLLVWFAAGLVLAAARTSNEAAP